MNRPKLAFGLVFWSTGLHNTIFGAINKLIVSQKIAPPAITEEGVFLLILSGYLCMIIGALFIAYAFPKKAS